MGFFLIRNPASMKSRNGLKIPSTSPFLNHFIPYFQENCKPLKRLFRKFSPTRIAISITENTVETQRHTKWKFSTPNSQLVGKEPFFCLFILSVKFASVRSPSVFLSAFSVFLVAKLDAVAGGTSFFTENPDSSIFKIHLTKKPEHGEPHSGFFIFQSVDRTEFDQTSFASIQLMSLRSLRPVTST